MNVKFHKNCGKTEKFGKFYVYFLRLQKEIFFGVTTDDLLHL